MIQANIVVCNQGNIYLPHVFAQERKTACKIASILLEKPKPVNLSPVMQKVKDSLAIMLSPKQAEGVEMVFRHNFSIITGGPWYGQKYDPERSIHDGYVAHAPAFSADTSGYKGYVASLLRLNIRRRNPGRVYADCPLCGDHREKMNLNLTYNVWRCNYCGEGGGMLSLYAAVCGISNPEAYREICDALQMGNFAPDCTHQSKTVQETVAEEIPQSERASVQEIHTTMSVLLSFLSLTPVHREHLRTRRGLTDEQMTSGIIIPIRGVDELIHGLQIRLDKPIKNKSDPPERAGTKYLPLTSRGKNMGITSGSPVHFAGNVLNQVKQESSAKETAVNDEANDDVVHPMEF